MKELLKSKTIILFIVIVLGVIFLSTDYNVRLEEENSILDENYISMNLK